MESIEITNLIDYSDKLLLILDYLKYCFYALVILIVLNLIKGV